MHHQVSAVVIAMAEHTRLSRELAGQFGELVGKHRPFRFREGCAAVAQQKVLNEEVQLPGEFVLVEYDAVRLVVR